MSGKRWWVCPSCGKRHGEIRGNLLVIQHDRLRDVGDLDGYHLEMAIPLTPGIRRRCDNRNCRSLPNAGWNSLEVVTP